MSSGKPASNGFARSIEARNLTSCDEPCLQDFCSARSKRCLAKKGLHCIFFYQTDSARETPSSQECTGRPRMHRAMFKLDLWKTPRRPTRGKSPGKPSQAREPRGSGRTERQKVAALVRRYARSGQDVEAGVMGGTTRYRVNVNERERVRKRHFGRSDDMDDDIGR